MHGSLHRVTLGASLLGLLTVGAVGCEASIDEDGAQIEIDDQDGS